MLYKAFLSYSHTADAKLAPAIQSGLQGFARPWYRLRALRVFRDKTSLAVNPALWPSIERALEQSEYFVLLASPAAAASHWVRREIAYWLTHRSSETLLILLTEGMLAWDAAKGDFDWTQTTALPSDAGLVFADEPLHLDLRWTEEKEDQLSMRNAQFRDAIADLASTLHGRPKDDLVGEDVRRHRSAMRLAWSAIAALTLLTVAAVTAAYLAVQQRDLANERLRASQSRQLAVEALGIDEQHLDLALLLAVEANERSHTVEAERTLRTLLERAPRLAVILQGPIESFAFRPDGRELALGLADGSIQRLDTSTFRPVGGRLRPPDTRHLALPASALAQPAGLPMTTDPGTLAWLAFTPGARSLLTASPSPHYHPPLSTVYQWDLRGDQADVRRVDRAVDVALSPRGHTAVLIETFANSHRILFWSGKDSRLVAPPLPRHPATPIWLAFSDAGDRMAVGSHDDTVELWTGLYAAPVARLLPSGAKSATSATFSPDGSTFFFGTQSGAITRYDVATGREMSPLSGGHDARVVGLSAEPDGTTLTSVGENGAVVQWQLDRQGVPHEVIGRLAPPVGAVLFSRSGSSMAALQHLSEEALGALTLWIRSAPRGFAEEAEAFTELQSGRFMGERLPIVPAQTRGADDYLRKSLIALGGLHWSFHPPPVAFDPAGRLLATALPENRLALWHLGEPRALGWRLREAATGFTAAALSPDSRLLAWGSADSVNIMDLAAGRRLAPIEVPDKTVTAVAFSPDSQLLAFADVEYPSLSARIHVVSTATHRSSFSPPALPEQIVALAFGPDGRRLVSRSYGGQAVVWDLEKAVALSPALESAPPVLDLAVHPSRQLLALATEDEIVQLVDLTSGQLLPAPAFKVPAAISALAFHPDGNLLTIASQDGSVSSWDLTTHQPAGSTLSLPSAATSLAYDAEGRHLAVVYGTPTGSTVQLWDVGRHETVLPDLAAPPGLWFKVMLARDGSRLGWSSEGSGPILWEARLESWIARACQIANRDLSAAEWRRFGTDEPCRRTCAPYREKSNSFSTK